ncbi:DUF2345 domain-containing protein, partial [Acinetobacter rongchengensis]
EQIEHKIAKFNKALLLLNSPDGIGLSTQSDIHLSANGQMNHYAGDSINVSTQNNYIVHALNKMSMFAIQDVKWVAAQGKFSIHVQSNGMEILAQEKIQISSVDGQIVITAPNGISIKSRNSEIKLDDAGIGLITSHVLEHRSGQHVFKTGAKVESHVPVLPQYNNQNWIGLELLNTLREPYADVKYKIHFENNQIIEGKLVSDGKAHHDNVPQKAIKIEYEFNPEDEPWPDYEELFQAIEKNIK